MDPGPTDDHAPVVDPKAVPAQHEGTLEPNYYCRAWNPRRSKYCKSRAGAATQHRGTGRCKTHDGGGDKKVTHGLKRRYEIKNSTRIAELIEHFNEDPDPLNTAGEIAALRALFQDYIERYDAFTDALIAWHESYKGDNASPKPVQVLDRADAYRILAEITKAVERIERTKRENAITYDQLKRFLFGVDRALAARIQDEALIAIVRADIFAIPVT